MDEPDFEIYLCRRESCGFRFPMAAGNSGAVRCPRCHALAEPVEPLYQTPRIHPQETGPCGPEIEVILDNIRSTFNVGSIFRTADGVGLRHIHLCGLTPTPDNPKVAKTSLGAELSIPWSHHPNSLATALELKQTGKRLWALEGGPTARSIFDVIHQISVSEPIALVVGNEISGVDPGILSQCEQVLSIPMQGVKRSLNVSVAFGIAVYLLRYGVNNQSPH